MPRWLRFPLYGLVVYYLQSAVLVQVVHHGCHGLVTLSAEPLGVSLLIVVAADTCLVAYRFLNVEMDFCTLLHFLFEGKPYML